MGKNTNTSGKGVFFMSGCYSFNFSNSILHILENTGYEPVFVAVGEYGEYGRSELDAKTGSKFLDDSLETSELKNYIQGFLHHPKGRTLKEMIELQKKNNYASNTSILIISKHGKRMQIAQGDTLGEHEVV